MSRKQLRHILDIDFMWVSLSVDIFLLIIISISFSQKMGLLHQKKLNGLICLVVVANFSLTHAQTHLMLPYRRWTEEGPRTF